MRKRFSGRAGMALTFLLGLVIATAGTATAAKLITGKQIKDGSISSKDLSKTVQAQLKKAGAAGPAGAAGSPGAAGAKGDKGDKGDTGPVGPSNAFVGTRDGGVSLTSAVTPGDLVGRLSLPAGSYAVTASTTLENQDATFATTATCTLTVGGGSAQVITKLSKSPDGGFRDITALTAAGTLESAGTATLRCATGGGVVTEAQDTRIVAVKVGSLTGAPLETT